MTQRQLAGGLILRSLSENHASDREQLPDFYAEVNTAGEPERIKEGLRLWVRDLMSGHPTVTPDDFFVVVDPSKNNRVVSATVLIPQTWRYEDVILPAGRPELCGTLPEYRHRGLIRALFEAAHERSRVYGHEILGVTGIPYFYRQFGYTQAVDLDQHAVFQLSALGEPDAPPVYSLRPATTGDIPAIVEWAAGFARERLLSDAWTPDTLRYEITGRHAGYYPHTEYQLIVNGDGQPVGYLKFLDSMDEPYHVRCLAYVVGDQASYLETFGDVVQGIKRWAVEKYSFCPAMLSFYGGIHDTLEHLIDRSPGGLIRRREEAWYVRVPEPARFIRRIAAVLERRLDGSGAHRYSGELRVGFYDLTGLSLRFAQGRLIDVSALSGSSGYDVQFPWHSFWNVVFGYRTLDEMAAILPDIEASAKAAALLAILFPKKKSNLLGLT